MEGRTCGCNAGRWELQWESEVLFWSLQFSESRKQCPMLKEWERNIVRLRNKERLVIKMN